VNRQPAIQHPRADINIPGTTNLDDRCGERPLEHARECPVDALDGDKGRFGLRLPFAFEQLGRAGTDQQQAAAGVGIIRQLVAKLGFQIPPARHDDHGPLAHLAFQVMLAEDLHTVLVLQHLREVLAQDGDPVAACPMKQPR